MGDPRHWRSGPLAALRSYERAYVESEHFERACERALPQGREDLVLAVRAVLPVFSARLKASLVERVVRSFGAVTCAAELAALGRCVLEKHLEQYFSTPIMDRMRPDSACLSSRPGVVGPRGDLLRRWPPTDMAAAPPFGCSHVTFLLTPMNAALVDGQLAALAQALELRASCLVILQGSGIADSKCGDVWPCPTPDGTPLCASSSNIFGSAFNFFASPVCMARLRRRLFELAVKYNDDPGAGTLVIVEYSTCFAKNAAVLSAMASERGLHTRWVGPNGGEGGKHVAATEEAMRDKVLAQYYRLYVAWGGWRPEPPSDFLSVFDALGDFQSLDLGAWREFRNVQSGVEVDADGIFTFDSPANLKPGASWRADVLRGGYFVCGLPTDYADYVSKCLEPALAYAADIGDLGRGDGRAHRDLAAQGAESLARVHSCLESCDVTYVQDGTDYDNNMATAALLLAWPEGKAPLRQLLTCETPNLAFPRAGLTSFLDLNNKWVGYATDPPVHIAWSNAHIFGAGGAPVCIVDEQPAHGPILRALYQKRNLRIFEHLGLADLYEVADGGAWEGFAQNGPVAIPGWLYRPMYMADGTDNIFCTVAELMERQRDAQVSSRSIKACLAPYAAPEVIDATISDEPTIQGSWGCLNVGWRGKLCGRTDDACGLPVVPWPHARVDTCAAFGADAVAELAARARTPDGPVRHVVRHTPREARHCADVTG